MIQRTVSVHCHSPSVRILDGCHVIGFITEMCRTRNCYLLRRTPTVSVATDSQAGDKISQQAIARTEIEGHGAALALSAIEVLGGVRWRGHQGAPKKRPWTAIRGGAEIPAHAHAGCRTDIEGRGAACWWGPPRHPEKAGLLFGGARYRPVPARAARLKLRASEQRAGGGHQGALKKRLGTAIRGGGEIPAPAHPCRQYFSVMRTRASPATSASELTKNQSSRM